jgi:Fe-S oxidoreductase
MKRRFAPDGSGDTAPSADALLARHATAQDYCNLCPRLCHHSCPVSNADRDESVTPAHKNGIAGLVRLGKRPLDEGTAELFHKCNGCRLCTSFCEHGNDVAMSLFAARAVAVSEGVVLPGVAGIRESFDAFGNGWEMDLSPRLDPVPPERRVGEGGPVAHDKGAGRIPVVPGRGLRLYWPGCATLATRPQMVPLTLSVCDRLGEADLSVYGGEVQCCGYPLLAAGDLEGFQAQARKARGALDGADAIFTAAPECAWTMSTAWPEQAGVAPPAKQVAHLVDLLLPALRHAPAAPPLDLDAVYHDPCYLGRFLGRYDEPRTLMNRLLRKPMAEAEPWARERGYCSGAGGVLPVTSPETADAITRTRVGHLAGTTTGPPGEPPDEGAPRGGEGPGGRRIVTGCPKCVTRFQEAGAQAMDLVEVLAEYLGLDGGEPAGGGRR